MEKSVTTPDQYPLTLNSLVNACNQKSGRQPVMSLQQGEVQHAVRDLQDKHLIRVEENFKSRSEKYVQRFCNTRFSDYQFDTAQYAIICLLMLRGAQTPGELRSRSGRLHTFSDNEAVVETLGSLLDWDGGPLVVKLARSPGRKDSEYMHLFNGVVTTSSPVRSAAPSAASKPGTSSEIEQRVLQLETEVAMLRAEIAAIKNNSPEGN